MARGSASKDIRAMKNAKIAVLGASGYTGSELLRLLIPHPRVEIALITADRKAGQEIGAVYPQFAHCALPKLISIDAVDWGTAALDLAFCALPHGTTQRAIQRLLAAAPGTKVADLSADFRLADPAAYARWYGHEHFAPELQKEAVYGLVEIYRREVRKARLVAIPGCYPTCAALPLIPLLRTKAIEPGEIVIDAKSGMTGAGRSLKEDMIFSEVAEGIHAYGVGHHRHVAELDQEFSKAAGREVIATFTPHLMPMNRGLLSTIYVRGRRGRAAEDLHDVLARAYAKEPFVHVLPFGVTPQTRHVRGSNLTAIGVAKDRVDGRAIIVSALDNLAKGASGQAVQAMNLMLGFPETLGLGHLALFP
jgi:N-acetyl-gamma-glutamyl-phosphate reductase